MVSALVWSLQLIARIPLKRKCSTFSEFTLKNRMEGQHDGVSIQVGVYFPEAKADVTTLLNRQGKIKEKGGYREAKRIY